MDSSLKVSLRDLIHRIINTKEFTYDSRQFFQWCNHLNEEFVHNIDLKTDLFSYITNNKRIFNELEINKNINQHLGSNNIIIDSQSSKLIYRDINPLIDCDVDLAELLSSNSNALIPKYFFPYPILGSFSLFGVELKNNNGDSMYDLWIFGNGILSSCKHGILYRKDEQSNHRIIWALLKKTWKNFDAYVYSLASELYQSGAILDGHVITRDNYESNDIFESNENFQLTNYELCFYGLRELSFAQIYYKTELLEKVCKKFQLKKGETQELDLATWVDIAKQLKNYETSKKFSNFGFIGVFIIDKLAIGSVLRPSQELTQIIGDEASEIQARLHISPVKYDLIQRIENIVENISNRGIFANKNNFLNNHAFIKAIVSYYCQNSMFIANSKHYAQVNRIVDGLDKKRRNQLEENLAFLNGKLCSSSNHVLVLTTGLIASGKSIFLAGLSFLLKQVLSVASKKPPYLIRLSRDELTHQLQKESQLDMNDPKSSEFIRKEIHKVLHSTLDNIRLSSNNKCIVLLDGCHNSQGSREAFAQKLNPGLIILLEFNSNSAQYFQILKDRGMKRKDHWTLKPEDVERVLNDHSKVRRDQPVNINRFRDRVGKPVYHMLIDPLLPYNSMERLKQIQKVAQIIIDFMQIPLGREVTYNVKEMSSIEQFKFSQDELYQKFLKILNVEDQPIINPEQYQYFCLVFDENYKRMLETAFEDAKTIIEYSNTAKSKAHQNHSWSIPSSSFFQDHEFEIDLSNNKSILEDDLEQDTTQKHMQNLFDKADLMVDYEWGIESQSSFSSVDFSSYVDNRLIDAHVTLVYKNNGVFDENLLLKISKLWENGLFLENKTIICSIEYLLITKRLIVFVVELPASLVGVKEYPHITVRIAKDVEAVEANIAVEAFKKGDLSNMLVLKLQVPLQIQGFLKAVPKYDK
eukprot:TRINITY_DN3230_c0_g4_i1.p1 TRINITY_DN3230_c0_g4~~TRINITY_DN3230_c0_g4_i1.p1  ORF type:complete len:922 (+),score=253.67 TRINITY_DN3230_c0_g4_i1:3163-5928(+)